MLHHCVSYERTTGRTKKQRMSVFQAGMIAAGHRTRERDSVIG